MAKKAAMKTSRSRNHWLMKTEPNEFSIDDLIASPVQTTFWFGVRNYQARNLLRDEIKRDDHVLFYHSSCAEPAVVGTAIVVREAYPDHTAFDPKSEYFDAKGSPENPRWFMVDIKLVEKLLHPVTIAEMRTHEPLAELPLLRKGNRLSVQPTTAAQFAYIVKLAKRKPLTRLKPAD
jgi:predicted RNA-binding protein with PUA-like domain